jgi:hypothetical protein
MYAWLGSVLRGARPRDLTTLLRPSERTCSSRLPLERPFVPPLSLSLCFSLLSLSDVSLLTSRASVSILASSSAARCFPLLLVGSGLDQAEETKEETDEAKALSKVKKIVCRLCKGDHFTSKCPYKETLEGIGMNGSLSSSPFFQLFPFFQSCREY